MWDDPPQQQRPLYLSHFESVRFGRQSAARRGCMITRQASQRWLFVSLLSVTADRSGVIALITGLTFTISKRGCRFKHKITPTAPLHTCCISQSVFTWEKLLWVVERQENKQTFTICLLFTQLSFLTVGSLIYYNTTGRRVKAHFKSHVKWLFFLIWLLVYTQPGRQETCWQFCRQ